MNHSFFLTFLLTSGFVMPSSAAQGLSSLFKSLQKSSSGRHSIRDLSHFDDKQEISSPPFIPTQHMRVCMNDRTCGRGQFCDLHYGVCRDHLAEGKACRSDSMCQGGYHCMFGICHKRIKRGREGARCRHERDCGAGMCCARRHGQQVCQRRVALGHKCYVPDGGLRYSMNEQCPCESGLVCRYKTPHHRSHGHLLSLMAAQQNMRCAMP